MIFSLYQRETSYDFNFYGNDKSFVHLAQVIIGHLNVCNEAFQCVVPVRKLILNRNYNLQYSI